MIQRHNDAPQVPEDLTVEETAPGGEAAHGQDGILGAAGERPQTGKGTAG